MHFKHWLLISEAAVQGSIRPVLGGAAYQADYVVQGETGTRKFNSMFSYTNGAVHINWFGGDEGGDDRLHMTTILDKLAADVCQKLGPITDISYTPSGGPVGGRNAEQSSALRKRLFDRYIRQMKANLPTACQRQVAHNPEPESRQPGVQNRNVAQPSRYASHPMRSMFKGTDDEFSQWFGVK